jgi:RND family efflux transporter MFP subunit
MLNIRHWQSVGGLDKVWALLHMKKWVLLVMVLAAGGWGFQKWRVWKPAGDTAQAGDRATTATVETRDIRFAVNAAGDIGPAEQVSVRPEINGKIERLPVDIGDPVKKGELLFGLDDKELQNQKASNVTAIERAQLELEQAERNFKRAEQLHEEMLISSEVYENTKTQFELAKNAIERARKELDIIDERLTKTQVLAPFDCTVLTRPVSIGQAVSGSGGFNSGTEVLTIADLHAMVINAHINQADVTRLKVGEQVEVEVEAVQGLNVVGTVERVAPQATIKNNIKGFAARILLTDVDPRVRPGMTANIKIPVASADNVLAVPLAAVFTETNPETGEIERSVYVEKGGDFERRSVQIGVSDFFYAEVQRGLAPGDVVSLELPRSAQGKQAKAPPALRAGAGEAGTARRPASPAPAAPTGGTGAPRSGGTANAAPVTSPKTAR